MPAFRELLGKAVCDQFVVLVIDGEAGGIYYTVENTEVRIFLYLDPVLADLFLERKGTIEFTGVVAACDLGLFTVPFKEFGQCHRGGVRVVFDRVLQFGDLIFLDCNLSRFIVRDDMPLRRLCLLEVVGFGDKAADGGGAVGACCGSGHRVTGAALIVVESKLGAGQGLAVQRVHLFEGQTAEGLFVSESDSSGGFAVIEFTSPFPCGFPANRRSVCHLPLFDGVCARLKVVGREGLAGCECDGIRTEAIIPPPVPIGVGFEFSIQFCRVAILVRNCECDSGRHGVVLVLLVVILIEGGPGVAVVGLNEFFHLQGGGLGQVDVFGVCCGRRLPCLLPAFQLVGHCSSIADDECIIESIIFPFPCKVVLIIHSCDRIFGVVRSGRIDAGQTISATCVIGDRRVGCCAVTYQDDLLLIAKVRLYNERDGLHIREFGLPVCAQNGKGLGDVEAAVHKRGTAVAFVMFRRSEDGPIRPTQTGRDRPLEGDSIGALIHSGVALRGLAQGPDVRGGGGHLLHKACEVSDLLFPIRTKVLYMAWISLIQSGEGCGQSQCI